MKPLVSVVIPVYNCQAFLAEAVRSVLAQDYPCLQVIVADDGSTDGSVDVARSFAEAIELLCLKNGGPANARNAGLTAARGKYVAFLDADDVWLPGKLAAQVEHLEANEDVGICYTAWHVWEKGPMGDFERPSFATSVIVSPRPDVVRSGWIYGRLLFDCELLTTTVMMRAETVRKVGHFDPSLPVGEDYDLWLRMARAAKITRLDCVGALYRVLATSASRVPRTRNYEFEVVSGAIERYGMSESDGRVVPEPEIRRRLDQLTFQHAYTHLQQGDANTALKGFVRLAVRAPWRIKLWAQAGRALWRRSVSVATLARRSSSLP